MQRILRLIEQSVNIEHILIPDRVTLLPYNTGLFAFQVHPLYTIHPIEFHRGSRQIRAFLDFHSRASLT